MAEAKETMAGWNFKPSKNYGNDHRAYFREYKMQLAENKTPETEDAPAFRVNIQGRDAVESELPSVVRAIAELARNNGFSTQYRYSQTFEEGAVYKGGIKAGERRKDKLINHWAMRLTRSDGRGAILTWANTVLVTAITNDGATMTPIANNKGVTNPSVYALQDWINGVGSDEV